MKTPPSFGRRAFTLIELLVVITIIAILVSVSLTAFNGIKKRAMRTAAVATMRTIGVTLEAYVGDNDGYYPPGGDDSDAEISAVQSAALRNPSLLAYYFDEMIDPDQEDDSERKVLREIVPKAILPYLEEGEGNEKREIYFLYHIDIDNTDPIPAPSSLRPGNSPWGNKATAIGFPKGRVPMLSDIYLGPAWNDYKTKDKQTFWGNTFNVHYWDGSVATLREEDFEWRDVVTSGGG